MSTNGNDWTGKPTNGNALETLREELFKKGGGAEPLPPEGKTDQDRLRQQAEELTKDFE